MINPHRDELAVDFGGSLQTFRITFQAIAVIEQSLNTGILEIANRFIEGKATVTEMNTLLHATLKAAGGSYSFEETGRTLLQEGVAFHTETCVALLTRILEGCMPFLEKEQSLTSTEKAQPAGKPSGQRC